MRKSYSSPSSMPSTSDEDLHDEIWTLSIIPSLLVDAESMAVHSNSGMFYLKQLRRIAYEAEDALQDYEIQGICRKCGEVRAAAPCPSTSCLHCRAKDEIRSISERYSEIHKKWASLRSNNQTRQRGQCDGPTRETTGLLFDQQELYGMKNYKDQIVQLLSDPESFVEDSIEDECKGAMYKNLTILPIAGVAGGGKTTLVRHICNDENIKNEFKLMSWVCAAGAGDVLSLTNSVLESICGDGCKQTQLSLAQTQLKDNLNGKKLLLVVDDACETNPNFWSKFWTPIVLSVVEGSIALITVREYEVISAQPPQVRRTKVCLLRPLSFEDCWSLFQSRIQSEEILQDKRIEKIGKQIVRKYEGIPLAIIHAARSLRYKDDVSSWKEFLENASLDSEWVASYRELKPQLKRCLLYGALFPKGHLFAKDKLIKLWMSEGFIDQPRGGKRLEDVGNEYFTDLLHKFLMLHKGEEYVMPAPVHDLAESILDHRFCRADRNIRKIDMESVRHASFVVHEPQEEEVEFNIQNPKLRTFLVVSEMNFVLQLKLADNAFSNFGYMRTLDLSYTDIVKLPSSIDDLRSLHFLGLNGTLIEDLPDSLCELHNLQTLELDSCRRLRELPEPFGKLVHLRHLNFNELTSFRMPVGVAKLTSLQTFPIFKVGRRDDDAKIEELEQLVNLRGTLSIMGLCYVRQLASQILGNLEFLRELTLCWSSDWDGSNDQSSSYYQKHNEANEETCSVDSGTDDTLIHKQLKQVFGSLQPHANLQNLYIQSYGGKEFPEWLGDRSFKKLKFVKINNCKNCDALPSLGNLPSLKNLSIHSVGVSQINSQFGMFSSLETLAFNEMHEWKEWFVDAKAFPKLELLELLCCPHLMGVPLIGSLEILKMETCGSVTELPLLPSLRVLEMKNCSRVVEIPQIRRLKTLEIEDCGSVTELPLLPSLQVLKMKSCSRVVELPAFPRLRKLKLLHCEELATIPSLASLQHMHIRGLDKLERLTVPKGLSKLILMSCKASIDWDEWYSFKDGENPSLQELEFFKFVNLGSTPEITSLKSLKIESCEKMIALSCFPSLQSLHICDCDELWELPTIESLASLSLMYCEKLMRICYQPKLQSLWVESCSQLRYVDQTRKEAGHSRPKVGMLASLDSLFIANCNQITHCIPTIPNLVIDQYTFSLEKDGKM